MSGEPLHTIVMDGARATRLFVFAPAFFDIHEADYTDHPAPETTPVRRTMGIVKFYLPGDERGFSRMKVVLGKTRARVERWSVMFSDSLRREFQA